MISKGLICHWIFFLLTRCAEEETKCEKLPPKETCVPVSRRVCEENNGKDEKPICQEVEKVVPKEKCNQVKVPKCRKEQKEVCDKVTTQKCSNVPEEVPLTVRKKFILNLGLKITLY